MGPTTRSKKGSPVVNKAASTSKTAKKEFTNKNKEVALAGTPQPNNPNLNFHGKGNKRNLRKAKCEERFTIKQPVPPMVLRGLPHISKSFVGPAEETKDDVNIDQIVSSVEEPKTAELQDEHEQTAVLQDDVDSSAGFESNNFDSANQNGTVFPNVEVSPTVDEQDVTADQISNSEQNSFATESSEENINTNVECEDVQDISIIDTNVSQSDEDASHMDTNIPASIEHDSINVIENTEHTFIIEKDVSENIKDAFIDTNTQENIEDKSFINETSAQDDEEIDTKHKITDEPMKTITHDPVLIGPQEPPKEFFEKVKSEPTEISGSDIQSDHSAIQASQHSKIDESIHSPTKINEDKSFIVSNNKQFSIKVVKKSVVKSHKDHTDTKALENQNEISEQVKNIEEKLEPPKTVDIKTNIELNEMVYPEVKSEMGITDEVKKEEKTKTDDKQVEEESKVEYISVYSSSEDRKKKLAAKKAEETSITKVDAVTEETKITPYAQPMLVDPAQLERETEEYYKEVSKIETVATNNSVTTKQKTKRITPFIVAKIAKDAAANDEASREIQAAWSTLHQYWTHVQENPYDFDGWTYLLNHVETMDNIEAARSAFEGFLPLYPYCFAYWKKLSDLELKFSDLEQSLGVLVSGSRSVPFCCDLWVPLLEKFQEYATKENISEETVRGMYEYALDNVGLSWHSSPIWQLYIDYEMGKEDLQRVMHLYKRLISVPAKLYMKHWDSLLGLIRDYHPRNMLSVGEYYKLKKYVCDKLKIKFTPPPMVPPKHLLKTTQPEDTIQATMKEILVANLIPVHEANEKEVDKRWKYEEKLKRPYFHVKPLEKKQLKAWKEYLDFEIKEGDPVRVVSLFERCLVPCALYEELWCKYASYMEDHVLNVSNSKYSSVEYKPGCFLEDKKNVPEESKEEEKKQMITLSLIGEQYSMVLPLNNKSKKEGKEDVSKVETEVWDTEEKKSVGVTREIKFEVMFLMNRLCENVVVAGKVLNPPSLTPSSILQGVTWDDVRQIYRRGAWIHCPSKPLLLMQWAEFEESQGNVQTARELLNTVITKHPNLLKVRLQLIELERRTHYYDRVEELYAQAYAAFKEPRIKSYIAIRYARFLFKVSEEDEKALMILRKAMKKDKTNIHLYHHVFDICYQRRPVDCDGVLAAVMLALAAKEVSLEEKHWFCEKRTNFLKEHGTMAQLKRAKIESAEIELKYEKEKAQKRKLEQQKAEEEKAKLIKEVAATKEEESKKSTTETKTPAESSATTSVPTKDIPSKTSSSGTTKTTSKEPEKKVAVVTSPTKKSSSRSHDKRSKRSRSPHHHHHQHRRSKRERDGEERERGEIREHHRRSSKRSRRSRERHHPEDVNAKPKESIQEVLYAPDGTVLYNPNEPTNNQGQQNLAAQPGGFQVPGQMNPGFPNQQLPSFPGPGQGMPGYQQMQNFQANNQPTDNTNRNYAAMPPTWDVNTPSMANYGYGTTPMVKENQNALYNRYYDLLNQGYKDKDGNQQQQPQPQMPYQQPGMANNMMGGNMGMEGRTPNSYLPPPPVPQGILGDSLFNQGNLSNLHRPFGRGELNKHGFEPGNVRPPFQGQGMPNTSAPPPNAPPPPFPLQGQPLPQFTQPPPLLPSQKPDNPLSGPPPMSSSMNIAPPGEPLPPQQQEIPIVSSGRNTINVAALIKEQRNKSTDDPNQHDDNKMVSSGRNTINVAALLKDRQFGNDMSSEHPNKGHKRKNRKSFDHRGGNLAPGLLGERPGMQGSQDFMFGKGGDNRQNNFGQGGDNRQNNFGQGGDNRQNNFGQGGDNRQNNFGQGGDNRQNNFGQGGDNRQNNFGQGGDNRQNNFGQGGDNRQNNFGQGGDNRQNNFPSIPRNLPNKVMVGFNVPDWLVNEGGELTLSTTQNGVSLLRFWPRYMNEHGHKTLFQSLRKSVKWFQRRCKLSKDESWVALPKLISWFGPCDYEKDGMILLANTNWPPEIVDLLHRLNHFSSNSFNSCFMSLYTNGFSHHPWHNEEHTAIENNPTIATISLGATRTMEMRRKDGPEYIRLPLLPGSLFVLEGAAQSDWLCQIPKEPEIVNERISVSFRMMLMIEGVTV